MAIPELDLKKVNLQAAVGYLISLHDNEVDWNLLGIKVIGLVPTAADIPEGTYEYGDAYEVGTEPPYDLYIYTRPDGEVHTEGYWFPVGKFPMPGPQGPKGDGLEQINREISNTAQYVNYNPASGATLEYKDKTLIYKDSTTGETKTKTYSDALFLPIRPGKYISINNNSDHNALEVKVDDTALALDYYKMDKSQTATTIPYWDGRKAGTLRVSSGNVGNSVARRDDAGSATFHNVKVGNAICDVNGDYLTDAKMLAYAANKSYAGINFAKTANDEGTINSTKLTILQTYPHVYITYENKVYYRIEPQFAPKGTLDFIHIGSIDDGNGGYKATGKCFRITVSTREWKVFDLDFGGSTPSQATEIYRHGITMNDANIVVKLDIYDSNSQNYTYEQLKAKMTTSASYCANARIKRSDSTYYYSPATIAYWNDSTGDFQLTYNNTEGNSINVNWTPSVVADNGTQIL